MINEQLIDQITRTVMAALSDSSVLQALQPKQTLRVLGAIPEDLSDFDRYELEPFSQGGGEDQQPILISEMDLPFLSLLAEAKAEDARVEAILNALLNGVDVWIYEPGVSFLQCQQTANPVVFSLLEKRLESIFAFGVSKYVRQITETESQSGNNAPQIDSGNMQVVDTKKPSCKEKVCSIDQPEPLISAKAILDGKLIQEKQLRRLHEQGHSQVQLCTGAIITPLARDYIKLHKLRVYTAEEL